MGGDSPLRDIVHLRRTDLNLVGVLILQDRQVDGLVLVRFGVRDEVPVPAGDVNPMGLDQVCGGKAVVLRLRDDSQGQKIEDIVDGHPFVVDLTEDAVGLLDSAVDGNLQAVLFEQCPKLRLHPLQVGLELILAG